VTGDDGLGSLDLVSVLDLVKGLHARVGAIEENLKLALDLIDPSRLSIREQARLIAELRDEGVSEERIVAALNSGDDAQPPEDEESIEGRLWQLGVYARAAQFNTIPVTGMLRFIVKEAVAEALREAGK
jgi:hypothetical protein